jgi:hypothetical protein
MKKRKQWYRLPCGKITTSQIRYLQAWKRIYKPLSKALGCEVIGFDPGLHLVERGAGRGFQISTSLANRIIDLFYKSGGLQ